VVVFLLGITAACAVFAKRQKLFPASLGYYVVTLVPVLGIVQVGGQSMADRYVYLPSVGPFLLIGLGTAWVLNATQKRNPAPGVIVAGTAFLLLASMLFLTTGQIRIWRNSFDLWSYAIEKEPAKASVAYKNRGVYFYETGQFDKAIADYSRAIDLDPRYVHAYNNRGLALNAEGQPDRAVVDYSKAIALKPNYFEAYANRGLSFDDLGQIDKAIADYDEAIALKPSDYNLYNWRGISFDKTNRFEKAIADYDKAIALNPASYEAYQNRGVTYLRTKQYDRALQDCSRAIELNRDNALAYDVRGNLYVALGKRDLAAADFRKACDLGSRRDCDAMNLL